MEKKQPKLQLLGISKQFPGVLALDNVSLTVERGKWGWEIHVDENYQRNLQDG